MVAYSFQPQFVDPIRSGRKCQTMRAYRRRHANKGEEVQLYTGMRTKRCRLIGRATCSEIAAITFRFGDERDRLYLDSKLISIGGPALDEFARADGFANWPALREFWKVQHGGPRWFDGVIIYWRDMRLADQ